MKTLVMWTAEWCAPCKAMKRVGTLEKLAKELGVELLYIDTEDYEELADENKVFTLPTIELRENTKLTPTIRLGLLLLQWKGGANFESLKSFFKKGVEHGQSK